MCFQPHGRAFVVVRSYHQQTVRTPFLRVFRVFYGIDGAIAARAHYNRNAPVCMLYAKADNAFPLGGRHCGGFSRGSAYNDALRA